MRLKQICYDKKISRTFYNLQQCSDSSRALIEVKLMQLTHDFVAGDDYCVCSLSSDSYEHVYPKDDNRQMYLETVQFLKLY
jgi:hypothetical protein